jgi:hypothetical protein
MTQPPTSGRGPGEEPARDSGSPGGGSALRLEHHDQRADRLTPAAMPGNSASVVIRQSATAGKSGWRSQM